MLGICRFGGRKLVRDPAGVTWAASNFFSRQSIASGGSPAKNADSDTKIRRPDRTRSGTLQVVAVPPQHTSYKAPHKASIVRDNDPYELTSPTDTFMRRHIGPDKAARAAMLKVMGLEDLDELIGQTVPPGIRRDTEIEIHMNTQSESYVLSKLKEIAQKNLVMKNFLGQGYHGTLLPPVILRNLFENPTWYTSYTPYQAEISQGRLESQLNFQTMVMELTAMELANASLLDEGTAAAEAMNMIFRATGGKKDKNLFFISDRVHQQTIDVMKGRAEPLGIRVVVGDAASIDFSKLPRACGALVQYPDTYGWVADFEDTAKQLHSHGAQLCVACDPLALTILRPPGEWGADVAVGSSQRFGVPMGFGGPAAAFLATTKTNMRRMPGRIIGISKDTRGDKAYRMTLQTREQHIRRDKATSNICTAQALLANISGMYAVYHGPNGLVKIAKNVRAKAARLDAGLRQLGYECPNGERFFDTVLVRTKDISADAIIRSMRANGVNIRRIGGRTVSVSIDETHSVEDIDKLLDIFAQEKGWAPGEFEVDIPDKMAAQDGEVPARFNRTSNFMKQQVFNQIQTETEMMRYLKSLEQRDLGLNWSMISLGSCTMKLNSASSLLPLGWTELSDIHPFAPQEQTEGYQELIFQLCGYLSSITEFSATSIQPNAGSAGEYAGLTCIKSYHESRGQAERNICLIPQSAHGTNPASAAMAAMKIVLVPNDKEGSVDIDKLKELAEKHSENLSCLMITYPSTFGKFDENIREICNIIHAHGGQVYMDGANMNAQLGLTSPARIGADVCHLNLHKTFGIPHGGGGPGVGPICVKEHLAQFLPSHSIVSPRTGAVRTGEGNAVASAPYGSALVLPISWMFISMLGAEGLTASAEYAILNANYTATVLGEHYPIKFLGSRGRCAHEFILDVSHFKGLNITEEDIAKRLIDYGFHSPTMSWPVPGSLMIEPTESESKAELDRFCGALIGIRQEIAKIQSGEWPKDNNPVKRSPHTIKDIMDSNWDRPYTREEAAFPAKWIEGRGKFWPSVGRVDNAYGDKVLVCECGSVSDYVS